MKKCRVIGLSALILLGSVNIFGQIKKDILFKRQWGFVNTGQSLYRSTGELTQDQIVGTPGVDINYLDIAKNNQFKISANREVVVAILDTGLDINHPELKERIYVDKNLCPTQADLRKKPCSGINILEGNLNLIDDDGHGTHVAGIIAANTNRQGIAGVTDPRVKILPVKVLNKDIKQFVYNKKLVTDWFADGIAYALARGVDVINMSIGWPAIIHTPKMKAVLKAAAKKNVPIVVAAGNNNKEIPTYPCTEENVICVGAYDNQGALTEFSNFGGKVDISAPGEFIVSLYPLESVESRVLRIKGYEVKNGTSQAAPFISAIAATIKLAYPGITYDELRARLFSSAQVEKGSDSGKFTQFGRVNMKKALTHRPDIFVAANFKSLLDVNYEVNSGKFTFPVELKSYVSDEKAVEVEVSIDNKAVELSSAQVKLDLYKGTPKKIQIEGRLTDLSIDTNQMIHVKIKTKEKVFNSKTRIVFSRDLNFENIKTGLLSEKIEGAHYSDLLYFRGARKASRLKRVKTNYGKLPEYFSMKRKTQTKDNTVLTFVKRTDEKSWKIEDLKIRKYHSIIKVYKNDLDFDGKDDYLVYGILPGEKKLGYSYLLKGQEIDFDFNILDYEKFPLNPDELSDVQLIKSSFKGKDLKVPSFYATYRLPEEDNVDDLLEHIDEKASASLLYYLDPLDSPDSKYSTDSKDENSVGIFSLRALNGPVRMSKLKTDLGIAPWQNLSLERPFNVTSFRQQSGEVVGLLTSGAEFEKQYFQYRFKHTDEFPEVFPMTIPYAYASDNSSVLVWSMDKLGTVSDAVDLIVQPSREMARSLEFKGHQLFKAPDFKEFSTDNYRDPIFGVIGSFDDDTQSHLFEGRYFVHYRNFEGQKSRLRINRESSFPGVQFSETISPVIVKSSDGNRPGAFINSTLIFGSRLYTMVANGEGRLTRPAQLSVEIPRNCVHLNPEAIEGTYYYLLLCRERDNSASFKRLPLMLGK